MKRKLMLLLGSMLFISLVAAILIKSLHLKPDMTYSVEEDKLQVVTSFYPIYMIGLNLSDQLDQVEVKCLTDVNTGCLHDYQLTTEDMKAISKADVFIINGGGMEGFLEDIRVNYPDLTIIDASQGITMLKYEANEQSADFLKTDNITKSKEHILGKYNPHIWLNPMLYTEQIKNVTNGLIQYINSSAMDKEKAHELIRGIDKNSNKYINEVNEIDNDYTNELNKLIAKTNQTEAPLEAVIFHDSFAYIADRIGLKIAFSVPLDSDTSLSAGDIATIINTVKKNKIKFLFTEQQYSDSIAKQIEEETDAKVYIINSVVTGDGAKDSYLKDMRANLEVLKQAFDITK